LTFKEFNFNIDLVKGIEAIGFEKPTPIQEKAIPVIMEGKDLIASAQTGTGKTAAFLLPVIHKIISSKKDEHIKALVIVPTRELAMQIDQQLEGFSYFTPISSLAVYGGGDGTSFSIEKKALTQGADVIIGTPGRLIAHLNMGYVKFQDIQYLILDEADRMLDMGFHEDIMKIIGHLPKVRQNLLFSATMPYRIRELARKVLKNPEEISIALSKPVEKVLQVAYVLYDNQKIPLVTHLLSTKRLRSIIIFCSTKISAKQLAKELKKSKLSAEEIHSDLDQNKREQVLLDFKNRKTNILVATDVISRGIDIEDIDLILNFDVPRDAEDYIHRIGRTARAEAEGIAITFIGEKEQNQFLSIEKLMDRKVTKAMLPKDLGSTPEYNPRKRSFRPNTKKKYRRNKK